MSIFVRKMRGHRGLYDEEEEKGYTDWCSVMGRRVLSRILRGDEL